MKKKTKDPRGRKSTLHAPIGASFDQVLGAIANSKYQDKGKLKAKTPKHGKTKNSR